MHLDQHIRKDPSTKAEEQYLELLFQLLLRSKPPPLYSQNLRDFPAFRPTSPDIQLQRIRQIRLTNMRYSEGFLW